MKRIWAITLSLIIAGMGSAMAQSEPARHHFFLGPEISHIKYEEPGIMEEKGLMYGIVGAYAYRHMLMLKAEGKLAYGQLDYVGAAMDGTPTTIANIDNYLIECRGLIGYDFTLKATTLTPYAGIGFRWLNVQLQKKHPGGYERTSNYLYLPLGVEVVTRFGSGWSLGATVEYDRFLWGKQKSHLSDVDPGFNDINNRQKTGYGIRGSVLLAKKGRRIGFTIEPFIKYWDIDRSDYAIVTYDGFPVRLAYEPENRSTEIGCLFAITF